MATEVFDEVGNVLGDTEEGIAGETEEGEAMTSEEAEALEKQGAEAKEEVSSLRKSVDSMKKLNEPEAEESFTDVVIKNVAIAAIFFGVNIFLKKLIAHSNGDEKQKIGDKQKKVTAIAQLMKGITHFAQELVKWTKENEGLMVGVGDGITVPFPDILSKFTTPMHKDVPQAFQVAKSLIKKDGSGKTKFSVPTSDQVGKLINSGEAVLDILQKIISFADEKKKRFPTLETLPIGKDDVDKLGDELKTIEKLPYT